MVKLDTGYLMENHMYDLDDMEAYYRTRSRGRRIAARVVVAIATGLIAWAVVGWWLG